MQSARNKAQWTQMSLIAVAMIIAGVFLTLDAWKDIYFIASKDEEASQVWLVPPVVAWLVYVRRGRFRNCRPLGSLSGAALVLFGWLLSYIGYYNNVQAFWHFGAVLVPVGAMVSVIGRDLIRKFFPAFLVLVFLVPVPGHIRQGISGPMMQKTAIVTESVTDFLGMPVERSGNQLTYNGQPLNIAEACNGLRMVFSLLLVSYAFAFGEPLRHYVRLLILLASPISAIVCNVIRMIPTIWVYGHAQVILNFFSIKPSKGQTISDMGKTLGDQFHNVAGWVMLIIAFLLLMGIIRILQWALLPVRHYTLASE